MCIPGYLRELGQDKCCANTNGPLGGLGRSRWRKSSKSIRSKEEGTQPKEVVQEISEVDSVNNGMKSLF